MPNRIDTAMSTRKRDRMHAASDVRLRGVAAFVRKHPHLHFTNFTSRGEPRWHSRFSVATVAASGD
ncbi:hypothetical protein CO709_01965 [Burkholderia thailandensis]|nr:hypothetical protein CO709_01965 [Burkholderia thailandensis]